MPDGRQVQKKLGPAWTDRGRPPAGYFTKRTAEAWLRDTLDAARRGTLPGAVATGATFADAAAEWLRYVEQDRDCKPSTLTDYRSAVSRLLPTFGDMRLEDITPGGDRGVARQPRRGPRRTADQPHPEQGAHDPRRNLGEGTQGLRPAVQSGARR